MKYATAAALLSLASAASIETRDTADLKFEITDFLAACAPSTTYCLYQISIVTSDNPDFTISCDAMGESDSGELPAVSKTQCGTYTMSVDKSESGDLVLTVGGKRGRLSGTHTLSKDDLTWAEFDEDKVQAYTGPDHFTIDVTDSRASGSTTSNTDDAPTTSVSPVSSMASSTATPATGTDSSEPSAESTTSSSAVSPTETGAATREIAYGGLFAAFGIMALVF
ncbi:hypothetical protein F4808DRAFT_398374 [Astrocystis sublimbata]|nr:hypothetical protein F4808DRAFT_398374 [Astrocystis sublimbata]